MDFEMGVSCGICEWESKTQIVPSRRALLLYTVPGAPDGEGVASSCRTGADRTVVQVRSAPTTQPAPECFLFSKPIAEDVPRYLVKSQPC